jgi:hypothetical protein
MTSVKIGQLFTLAYTKPLSTAGTPLPFAQMFFYVSGSGFMTQQTVYADIAMQTPLTQPITADTNGRFVPVFMNPALQYGWQLIPVSGPVQQADPVNVQDTSIPVSAFKAVSTGRSPSAPLAADPDLTYSIPTAGTYRVELFLQLSGSGSPLGFSYEIEFSGSLNSSAGNILAVAGLFNNTGVSNSQASVALNSLVSGIVLGAGGLRPSGPTNAVIIVGTIQVTSSGTLALFWAPNSTSAISMLAGSAMTVTQIG